MDAPTNRTIFWILVGFIAIGTVLLANKEAVPNTREPREVIAKEQCFCWCQLTLVHDE